MTEPKPTLKFKDTLGELEAGDNAVFVRYGGYAGTISFADIVTVIRVTKTRIVVTSPFKGEKEIPFMSQYGCRHGDSGFHRDRIFVGEAACGVLQKGREARKRARLITLLESLLGHARDSRNSLEDVERRLVKVYHTLGLDRVAEHQNSGEEQTDAD